MSAGMSHEEAWSLLDAYVDGEIPEGEMARVAAHVEECGECRREVERIRRLLARALLLPKEILPERDLWPAIEGEIGQAPAKAPARRFFLPRRRAVAWAAAAALLLAAIGLMSGRGDRGAPDVVTRTENVRWESHLARSAAVMTALRKECGGTGGDVARALSASRGDGAASRTYEENARIIDLAIAEVERAWIRNADDPELAGRLAHLCRMRAFLGERIAQSAMWA